MNHKEIFIDLTKFQLLDLISKGVTCEVFKVKEISTGEIYTAKIMNYENNEDPIDQPKILLISREINLMTSLKHPSILRFIGFSPFDFRKSRFPTIITKYAPNGSLRDILNLEQAGLSPQSWNDTRKLINIYGIASGLCYLHSHDITHRNIKPENILMDDYLFPKINDFYLSQISTFFSKSCNDQPPSYMAPEIFRDEPYTKSSDVYSFSIVLYEILTGETPFSNLNFDQIKEKVSIQNERPELTSKIPLHYQELLKNCWAQEAEERPTFEEIVESLKNNKEFLSGSINEDEFNDYVVYEESFDSGGRTNHFEEVMNQKGRSTTLKKVSIIKKEEEEEESHFFSFNSVKNFFGKFFGGSEKVGESREPLKKRRTLRQDDFEISSQGCVLRGFVIRPENEVKLPTVIVSHGFASCTRETKKYALVFVEEGYAAVCFDFCMSGRGKSSGSSLGMSVLTEKVDLSNVLDYVKSLEFVDSERISLVGCSQGGFVSALVAAERENDVDSLIMYYPALCIPDDARRGQMINAKFDPQKVPDQFRALFIKLSSKYALDVMQMDPFKEICGFKKPVLIVHGNKDKLVDISYSRRACENYANCRLVEVSGDHGFVFSGFAESKQATIEFLREKEK